MQPSNRARWLAGLLLDERFGDVTAYWSNHSRVFLNSLCLSVCLSLSLSGITELVKRTRSVKVHAYIIHYLRKQMPLGWGKKEKQDKLINRLDREFADCARRYGLARGDFPPVQFFKKVR